MRKEYSDLPASQKIIYLKRNAVIWGIKFVPILVLFGLLFTVLSIATELNKEIASTPTNSTGTAVSPSLDTWANLWITTLFILWLSTVFGLITLGDSIGVWLANKLNLYTDFELEDAEKNIAKIKKVLEERK